MKKFVSIAFVFSLLLLLSSCALLFKGEYQNVPVSSTPQGAEVFIDGVSYGMTPVQLNLKTDRAYNVVLRHGGEERTVVLRNEIGTLWVVLDIVSGLAPLIVDAATGAWYELTPEQVHVTFN